MSLHGIANDSAKVVLLGDSGVGKSSLALRFTRNEFRPYCESTIGASFMTKTVNVPPPSHVKDSEPGATHECGTTTQTEDEKSETNEAIAKNPRRIEFKIWDTAGQEKYASLAPMYYRGAAASILVYDITNRASFQVLKSWAEELRTNGPPGIVMAVCGNKLDLEDARQTPLHEAKEFATEIGAFYIETSARDDENVERMFVELGKRIPTSTTSSDDEGRQNSVNLSFRGTTRRTCC
jgi:small GTP-binding protein